MPKLLVTLEIDVRDISEDEQKEYRWDDDCEIVSATDYEPMELAEVLNSEYPEVWQEHFAGTDVWASFEFVTAKKAEWINE